MSVFDATKKDYNVNSKMFLDEDGGVTVARYDKVKYKEFSKLAEKQRGFFWQPEEVAVTKDQKDFADLTKHEQHIFTSNLKRQIILDSVQGRAPAMLLDICCLPELENWIVYWTFSEQIHSESYTHIIRNVYPNPSKVFDEIMSIEEIVDCAEDISKYYDELKKLITQREFITESGQSELNWTKKNQYELKKALWLCIHSINALEGVRFYVSFACSWAFAELNKMEGNAKIIKLICRDENLHLASTQQLIKLLPKDDPDFIKIQEECADDVQKMFIEVVDQEKAWADYLFKDGVSMIGLNADILKEYVEWIANKRMKAAGIESPYKGGSNPLPWTQKWIAGGNLQVAPQETEITSYVIGKLDQDLEDDTFDDIDF